MNSNTRRDFFRTTGLSILAASAADWLGCSAPRPAPTSVIEGAAEVEFLVPPLRPPDYSHDLERYLIRITNELGAQRKKTLEAINNRDQFIEHQKSLQRQFWEMLGGPFEKTPLNPRTTGTLKRSGYRIEKVVYESRPQLYVTANLYVPEGRSGRLPAILGPLGHSGNGKAYRSYQKLFSNLARKGYVVLAYDPFGQGERIEYPGSRPGRSRRPGGTGEHEYAGQRLILLGVNFSLYRAWDGIRGIDYLLSRPEVDPERIGCTGQSGGGTMTQFLVALDDRIRAAVVSEGNTENIAEGNVEPPGSADDAEQNIVPSLTRAMDRSDLLHVFAPKPLLVAITTHDAGNTYSPEYVSGTVEQVEELKRSYALLEAPDRVALVATAQRHGYVYEQRRAAYQWFNRWLDNKGADDHEAEAPVEPDEALFCTKTGFVVTSLGGETALSLTRKLAAAVGPPPASSREELLSKLRQALALPEKSADLKPALLCRVRKAGYTAEQFEIVSDGEIRVPGWVLAPDAGAESATTILYLGERAASGTTSEQGPAEQLCAKAGFRVCAVDLRGRGDCSPAYPPRGPHYFSYRMNERYLNWFTLVLGKPLLGGWVFDALQALDYLRTRKEIAQGRIWVMGDGPHGLIALYAAALDEKLRGAIVSGSVTDYQSLATADDYAQPFGIYLYNVLRSFDLPDVAAAAVPRPLMLLDATGPDGKPAGTEKTKSIYARTRQAYESAGKAEQFAVQASTDKAPALELVKQWIDHADGR
jgi:cephalosporin-C deacetylase-like acetyl esterase